MSQYKVVWIPEFIVNNGEVVELQRTTMVLNEYDSAGWRPTNVVPGTNAQTFSGLFVTLIRD